MRFTSITELSEWVATNGYNISDIDINLPTCSTCLSEDVDPKNINALMAEIDKEYPDLTEDDRIAAAENAGACTERDSDFEGFPNDHSPDYTPKDNAKFLSYYAASLEGIQMERDASSFYESKSISIKSLSETPKIKFVPLSESTEDDNVWYVDDYESIEGACSTSKVVYNGNMILMNVCESEGKSVVKLMLEIDGKIQNAPFRLEKSCTNDTEYDMIISI